MKTEKLENSQSLILEIGEVTEESVLAYGDVKIALADAQDAWTGTLEKVFATKNQQQILMPRLKRSSSIHPIFIFAAIRSDSQQYLFRYSLERTVSMTVPVHLREQAQRLLQKYSVTLMQKTSVDQ